MQNDDSRLCCRCHNIKPRQDFYNRRGKTGNSVYCKSCSNEQALSRQRKFKLDCIEYKGGRCINCGYNRCAAALEFHHINPAEKDVEISRMKCTKFSERTKKELDKCNLLCRNCHAEEHFLK
jgi:hypothetical protein